MNNAEKNFVIGVDGNIVDIKDTEVERLANECENAFNWCEIYPEINHSVMREIILEWFVQKKDLLNHWIKSPFYNGNYAIEFDKPIHRSIDKSAYQTWVHRLKSFKTMKPYLIGGKTYTEYRKLKDKCEIDIDTLDGYMYTIDGVEKFIEKRRRDFAFFSKIIDKFVEMKNSLKLAKYDYQMYDMEEYLSYNNFRCVMERLYNEPNQFITKETADYINKTYPKFKANEGQKTSRVINKLCTQNGIDLTTWEEYEEMGYSLPNNFDSSKKPYNYMIAMLGDVINPFVTDKHIFISLHPIDYLSMSWLVSTTSCHSIDKENKHKYRDKNGQSYRGCYSSGTMSYMLDNSSVVFYILGADAVEKQMSGFYGTVEPTPRKEMRQMFHIGKEKFIQGRLYPYDQTDNGNEATPEDYTQYREIMQNLISELWNYPNLWTNKKGSSACSGWAETHGTHYPDYERYSNPNISFLKDYTDNSYISIGAKPICPVCGERHYTEDTCFCGCNGKRHWCDYHEEYEYEEMTEVDGYGYVCYEALRNGDFHRCEECGTWFYDDGDDERVYSERNEVWFCSSRCAERCGYYYLDSESDYVHEDDFSYSEIDGEDLVTDRTDCVWARYSTTYNDVTIAYEDSCVWVQSRNEWWDADLCYEDVHGNFFVDDFDGDNYVDYNGEYYPIDECVEVDGEYVPINMSEMYAVDRIA